MFKFPATQNQLRALIMEEVLRARRPPEQLLSTLQNKTGHVPEGSLTGPANDIEDIRRRVT